MTSHEKLRALADWFDLYDQKNPTHQINGKEVQQDLRAIADEIEQKLQHGVIGKRPDDDQINDWVLWNSGFFIF